MKLAYIVLLGYGHSTGVEKATQGRALAARDLGLIDIDFIILNPTRDAVINGVRYVRYGTGAKVTGYIRSLFLRFRLVEKYINLEQYDSVILRYPFSDVSGAAFLANYRVITEHHTKEPQELAAGHAAASSVILRSLKTVRLALEKRYGPRTLNHSKAILAVTDEIRRFELNRVGREIPSAVIANGIDVSSYSVTGFLPFDGRELKLIIISSGFQPWLGLDRILSALSQYKGAVSIALHLVGPIKSETIKGIGSKNLRVQLHGTQSGAKLDEIMCNMNIAIGSMALYRNGLNQACTLKTREYAARGLPFIIAYEDPDLSHVHDDRFYLQLENDGSLFDVEAIIDFAESVSASGRQTSRQMREYAKTWMDWRSKLPRYLEFARAVYNDQMSKTVLTREGHNEGSQFQS